MEEEVLLLKDKFLPLLSPILLTSCLPHLEVEKKRRKKQNKRKMRTGHQYPRCIPSPLTPLGIWRKSFVPNAFWSALKVQLSVPVQSRSPLATKHEEIIFLIKHTCG